MTDDVSPRERRQERTRQAILTTALRLIVEKGPDKLSLREIARRIDYSPAGLYEYFGSKEEIIDAVCVEAEGRFVGALSTVPLDLPPTEYLVELGMQYIAFARENIEQFVFLFHNRTIDPDHIPEETALDDLRHDGSFGLLYDGVERFLAETDVQPGGALDTLAISYSIWAFVHGMAMLQARYLCGFPMDFPAVDRQALYAYLHGLAQAV